MTNVSSPRIAILGFAIESNRFAPVSGRVDFETRAYLAGDALMADARSAAPAMTPEIPAFVRDMDQHGAWTPVPILFANAESGGPVEHGFFLDSLARFEAGLRAALPVDAVYICEHGAAITTEEQDPDGLVFERVRAIVGPDVPVVATVDLHANVSDRMVDQVDVLISYRRNPHTDMADRGREAAEVLRGLMGGLRVAVAHIRLPIVSPPTQLLTAPGTGPYADMIHQVEAITDPRLVNASVVGGFAYGDTYKNGLTVLVTAREADYARDLALELAAHAWRERAAFTPELVPLAQAVALARQAGTDDSVPAVALADVADNPGGGGRGNTTFILRELVACGAQRVILGVFTDAALAAEAHAAGEGARFVARFNRDETTVFSEPYEAEATVLKLHGGRGVGRRGQLEGCSYNLGPSALLQVGGVQVAVITNRHQCHEPMFFEMFGVDIAAARTVVVKSRGHFRAAFDEFFKHEQIYHVDVPGLTSPRLGSFDFRNLPRPVVPLDPKAEWTPGVRMSPRATDRVTLQALDTPCLLLDETRMSANIGQMKSRMARLGVTLRPHLKTPKSVEVARLAMESPRGPAAVSTLQEAEQFARAGVQDILYAVGVSASKLDRVVALRRQGTDLTVVVDSVEGARAVAAHSSRAGERIPALIEVDTDGHRAGVRPDQTELLRAIGHALHDGGAELRGVMTHAGESYNSSDLAAIRAMAEQERSGAVRAAESLRADGLPCPVVSVGSTPTAVYAENLDGVTEVRAGVFVFFDLFMAGLGVCRQDDIALSVLTTVIGHQPDKGWILVDAGWMAMSRDRGTAKQAVDQYYGVVCDVQGRPYADLVMKDTNQEQGILAIRPGSGSALPDIPLGARLRILPNHACATGAQHEAYQVVRGESPEVVAVWPRFRGW
jgi:D-serine deaminase-like pyridoxal phosphate-dependent protein/microcystin degradation protein MlrC